MEDGSLSAAEAALYDRQLRLWGVEGQRRLLNSTSLVYPLASGLAAEVAKNCILAGMRVTLADSEPASPQDVSRNFLMSTEGVGMNRALACLRAAQELNPLVATAAVALPSAATGSSTPLTREFVSTFGLVICTHSAPREQMEVARLCREAGVPCVVAANHGFWAFAAFDFRSHTFSTVVTSKAADGSTAETSVAHKLEYPSLPDALEHAEWKGLYARTCKAGCTWAAYTVAASKLAADVDTSDAAAVDALVSSMAAWAEAKARAGGMAPTACFDAALAASLVAHGGVECAPVAAVMGGFIGQEVIKFFSLKDEPVANVFSYDAMGGMGGVVVNLGATKQKQRAIGGHAAASKVSLYPPALIRAWRSHIFMTFSLRDWQKAAFIRLLTERDEDAGDEAGSSGGAGAAAAAGVLAAGDVSLPMAWSHDWKVLIYDTATRAIVSPLLTVQELHACGVTLHMALESPRDSIPDVAAIYFLSPTAVAIRMLVDDAAAGRYRDLCCYFATPLPHSLMETLALGCVQHACVPRISRIADAFMAFVALQPRLFTAAGLTNSFAAFASPSATEEEVTAYAANVAHALISVCATVGVVPLIVAPPGGPAEMVARMVDQSLRDHLASPTASMFNAASPEEAHASPLVSQLLKGRKPTGFGFGAGTRPVCILLDRNVDLAAPLAHSQTYEALVDDCVGPITGNRVTLKQSAADGSGEGGSAAASTGTASWLLEWALGGGGGSSSADAAAATQTLSLDVDTDAFWSAARLMEFPRAIETHGSELASVMAREKEIRASTSTDAGALDMSSASSGLPGVNEGAGDLISAIHSLPALQARKKMLATHGTLMDAVFASIRARALPTLYELEAVPTFTASATGLAGLRRPDVLHACGDAATGSPADRLRVAAIYLLTAPLPTAAVLPTATAPPSAASFFADETRACLSALRASVMPATPAASSDAGGGSAPKSAAEAGASAAAEEFMTRATAVLHYIRHVRSVAHMTGGGAAARAAAAAGGGGGGGLMATLTHTTSTLFTRAASTVNRLVQGEAHFAVTRIVNAIMDAKPAAAAGFPVEAFTVWDARAAAAHGAPSRERSFGAYMEAMASAAAAGPMGAVPSAQHAAATRNAMVFMVGGGCYAEHADVQTWAASAKPERVVLYGATEMLHADGLLRQFAHLGRGAVQP